MGMYDEIVCEYPLPGAPPEFIKPGHKFQTKDTEPQCLETHRIEADGSFSLKGFHGEVNFYTSNIVGSGPGIYTQNGEDAESVEYAVQFVAGQLTLIRESERERTPALPVSRMYEDHAAKSKQESAK